MPGFVVNQVAEQRAELVLEGTLHAREPLVGLGALTQLVDGRDAVVDAAGAHVHEEPPHTICAAGDAGGELPPQVVLLRAAIPEVAHAQVAHPQRQIVPLRRLRVFEKRLVVLVHAGIRRVGRVHLGVAVVADLLKAAPVNEFVDPPVEPQPAGHLFAAVVVGIEVDERAQVGRTLPLQAHRRLRVGELVAAGLVAHVKAVGRRMRAEVAHRLHEPRPVALGIGARPVPAGARIVDHQPNALLGAPVQEGNQLLRPVLPRNEARRQAQVHPRVAPVLHRPVRVVHAQHRVIPEAERELLFHVLPPIKYVREAAECILTRSPSLCVFQAA